MEMFENDIKHAWIKHTSWRFKESRKMTKRSKNTHVQDMVRTIGSTQFPGAFQRVIWFELMVRTMHVQQMVRTNSRSVQKTRF